MQNVYGNLLFINLVFLDVDFERLNDFLQKTPSEREKMVHASHEALQVEVRSTDW